MSQNTIALSKECVTYVVETLKAESAVGKRWKRAADLLRAEGVTSEILKEDKDFRMKFQLEVITLSFNQTEQGILAKPGTVLTEAEKVTKRYLIQQKGSLLSKVIKHVSRAEEEEALSEEEKGARRVATLSTRLKADLTKWIARIEKAEDVSFSATLMIKGLKECAALIK